MPRLPKRAAKGTVAILLNERRVYAWVSEVLLGSWHGRALQIN